MNLSPAAWIESIEKHLSQTKGWLQMHQRVSALEQRLAALERGAADSGPVCAHCGQPNLTRAGTRPSPGSFGKLGLKEAIWRCNDCQQTSYAEIPLPKR